LASIVDLAILGKKQTGLPGATDARYFPLQTVSIQVLAPSGGGVAISLLGGEERDDDAAPPRPQVRPLSASIWATQPGIRARLA
jgi:hypothetical protein